MIPWFTGRRRRRAIVAVAFLGAMVLAGAATAKARQWMSSVGTQIEATCVAKVGNEHWLLESGGRIIKLTPDKLAPEDARFLESVPVAADTWINSGSVVALTTKDPAVLDTLEALAATKIPMFSVSGVRIEDAFRALSDAIEKNDPKRRRVEFKIDPALAGRTTSVTTRGLTGLRLIGFIFGGESAVSGTIGAGRVDFAVYQRTVPAEAARR